MNSATGSRAPNKGTNNKGRSGTKQPSEREADIWTKEEEYRKLNAELEAKTAGLVKEAENILRGQESQILGGREMGPETRSVMSLLNRVDSAALSYEYESEDDVNVIEKHSNHTMQKIERQNQPEKYRKLDGDYGAGSRRLSSNGNGDYYQDYAESGRNYIHSNLPSSTRNGSRNSVHENLSDNLSRLNIVKDSNKRTISGANASKFTTQTLNNKTLNREPTPSGQAMKNNSNNKLVKNHMNDFNSADDDIMPAVAMEMGEEAQMRFLKAKVRVTQEEVERLNGEMAALEDQLKSARSTAKQLEEENSKLQKKMGGQQSQVDKYKKVTEESKVKVQELETQVQSLKREIESMKREKKQQSQTNSTTEVRLNRAMEEVDKLKAELAAAKSGLASPNSLTNETRRIEELTMENKKLERQRVEVISAFKKQLRLIDVLKRQKLHLEASRLLQFTEEEFLKALDWGASGDKS